MRTPLSYPETDGLGALFCFVLRGVDKVAACLYSYIQKQGTPNKENTVNAKTQVLAENVTVGMKIIPAGRKKALEVIMADNFAHADHFAFGCMGQGFTVQGAKRGEYVTVAA